MKILYIDIETSPNLAHVWGLWNQNVGLSQLRESSVMMCFAAKWRGKPKVSFYRGEGMVEAAHALLDEADVVVYYNGDRFDRPILNKEFLLAGMTPPAPYKTIDLLKAVKSQFRFPSNKLDYVSGVLGFGGKEHHEGHMLWVKCIAGDTTAWKTMQKYNKKDVTLLEDVHDRLLPWLPAPPNVGLYLDTDCPRCPQGDLERRGWAYTGLGRFQRFRCRNCGGWSKSSKREDGVQISSL